MSKNTSCQQTQVSARFSRSSILLLALLGGSSLAFAVEEVNLAKVAKITSSSARPGNPAAAVADGVAADDSRWLAAQEDPAPWIEMTFPKPVKIGVVDVFSGWEKEPGLDGFDLTFEVDGKAVSAPQGKVRNLTENAARVEMGLENVTKMRLTLAKPGPARIREIAIYKDKLITLGSGLKGQALPISAVDRSIHQIAMNQVGYETLKSKRFTAPLSPDGTEFSVRTVNAPAVLFSGKIQGGIGDFSAFRPADSSAQYLIGVSGGSLKNGLSDPFLIRGNLYQDQFWQAAVDFLIDSRSVVGTHPSAFGGCPWRDGTYYDAILPSLVMLQRADPARIAAMPRQIDWQAEKEKVLAPGFKFDAKNPCSEGVMDSVRKYFTDLEPPAADAPDVVKLIHWGAGFYLVNPATKDPSKDPDPRQIHSQTVEQVAYVVWAWPALKQWLPESFYQKCRDFCFANWTPSLGISPWWESKTYLKPEDLTEGNPMGGLLHPYKGRHAPGHSIVPNLMMHEVAMSEGRDDADLYLQAAIKQAEWCVKNLDWKDPRTTKGHRMSEHRTIPNLVWMLQRYPEQAPAALKGKINDWADVVLSRSENMWDYRRYDMQDHWSIPKLNDVGNLLSFPAIATAASWVVDDQEKKARLEQISTATIDHVFGRNPRLAAAPANPKMGFPEIERGWPEHYKPDVCARLELCRGSISSVPGSEMFPFNPEGMYRHPEGWVNYGASWCISLAYLKFDEAKTTPAP